MRTSLAVELGALGLAAAVVAAVATWFVAAADLEAAVRRGALDEVRGHAAWLRERAQDEIARGATSALREPLQRWLGKSQIRAAIVAPDGSSITGSSTADRADVLGEPHSDPRALAARVAQALREGGGTLSSADEIALTLPIELEGKVVGGVLVAKPLQQELDAARAALRSSWIAVAVMCAAFGGGMGMLFGRRLRKTLHDLSSVVEALRRGEQAQPAATATAEARALGRALVQLGHTQREGLEVLGTERNKLMATLAGMAEGVVAVDRHERVLHMNSTAAAILRCKADEATGKAIWEVTRMPEVSETLSRTLAAGIETVGETVVPGRPEDQVFELRARPILDRHSEVAGAVVVLHDVTRIRRLEAMRRDFVANVSHELKTPLTAIRGLVETLLEDPQMEDQTQLRFLQKISNQANRLSALVTDLLTLSRVESGKGALERALVDLRNPVRESTRTLMPDGRAKRLDVVIQLPTEPVMVLGDAEALRQVVDNLLSNAIKYTPEGGRVTVRVETQEAAALVDVQDTGIGIAPRDQERIFERFYRVDKARSSELGGTGLGLAIVKHIVLALGGTVSVDSTLGKGSTFHVRIPLAKQAS